MRPDALRLSDMLQALERIRTYASGGVRAILEDPMAADALAYEVLKLGEAAAQVSAGLRSAHPEVPWDELIRQRNQMVHENFRTDPVTLWKFASADLDRVERSLRKVRSRRGVDRRLRVAVPWPVGRPPRLRRAAPARLAPGTGPRSAGAGHPSVAPGAPTAPGAFRGRRSRPSVVRPSNPLEKPDDLRPGSGIPPDPPANGPGVNDHSVRGRPPVRGLEEQTVRLDLHSVRGEDARVRGGSTLDLDGHERTVR
jgi:uncharacterized protein with HEPN domain